jgi:HPt (histidine-containing phosphotransfer) domain-containing protein
MTDPDPSPLDAQIYRDLSTLLGAEKVDQLLARLEEGLVRSFARFDAAPLDKAALGQEAHNLVSQAGMLGFLELAELCRELETACIDYGDPMPLLEHARRARDRAVQEIERLRSAGRQSAA